MSKPIAPSFARLSPAIRYFYFIMSSLRPMSYSTWKQRGEPNPFAKQQHKAFRTTRSELVSLFPTRLTSTIGRLRSTASRW